MEMGKDLGGGIGLDQMDGFDSWGSIVVFAGWYRDGPWQQAVFGVEVMRRGLRH